MTKTKKVIAKPKKAKKVEKPKVKRAKKAIIEPVEETIEITEMPETTDTTKEIQPEEIVEEPQIEEEKVKVAVGFVYENSKVSQIIWETDEEVKVALENGTETVIDKRYLKKVVK